MDLVDPRIEDYAEAHTTPPAPYLEALAAETRAELETHQMMVGPLEGRFLETMVFATGARRVLEIGMFTGYSALSMASALPPDGTIVTCEVDERHAAIARRHIAASPYADRIEIRMGPAIDTLAGLDGPFDLAFIDADKVGYVDYYEAVLPKLASRGVILADNTLFGGGVLGDAGGSRRDGRGGAAAAIREFNEHVRADGRVVAVMLTVRDGVTLIRRAG